MLMLPRNLRQGVRGNTVSQHMRRFGIATRDETSIFRDNNASSFRRVTKLGLYLLLNGVMRHPRNVGESRYQDRSMT